MRPGTAQTIPTTFFGGLDDRTKKFEAEFVQRVKAAGVERVAAGQFDAATYGIVQIYAQAMKTANVTGDPSKLIAERTAIRDEIRKLKDFPALEGPISFGTNGDALKPAYVIEIKDGKWNLLARIRPAVEGEGGGRPLAGLTGGQDVHPEEKLDVRRVRQLVIAGWTGRDVAALENHIRELEAIGVKRPKTRRFSTGWRRHY